MKTCKICNKNITKLGNHIFHSHKDITSQEYYDLYLKKPGDGTCECCGEPTAFIDLNNGYRITCSLTCTGKLSIKKFQLRTGLKNPAQQLEVRKKIKTAINNIDFAARTEKTKNTNIAKYGVPNYTQTNEFKEQVKKTCLEKYGAENMFASEHLKQKRIEKQDGKWLADEAIEKQKNTCLEKYGVEYYSQTDECKDRVKNTCLEKYGVEYYSQTDECKDRVKNTCLEKYGVEHYTQSVQYESHVKQSNMLKYGNEWYFASDTAKEKIRNSYMQKYGENIKYPLQVPGAKQKAYSHHISKPEKKLNEFLSNRKFIFTPQYEVNGKCFDFAIFKDDELSILVEVDGRYFHGLLEDSNGKHSRGETDNERFVKVPEGVKLIVCDENKIDECFKEILSVFDVSYDEWMNQLYESMPKEFPYPVFTEKRMQLDFKHLNTFKYAKNSYVGLSIVQNFHHSIYDAHCNASLAPSECWHDEKMLKEVIANRIIYKSNLSSHQIARGFNICKKAKTVSVFNPILAKHIVETYLSEYDTVFDPFSGFSGRMLGTCACNKRYIGHDINEIHVKESNEIIKHFSISATVTKKDIFESTGEYECLFTCSPYNLKEIWNENETDLSCDEWIDECLKRFKCKRYVFVVDKTEKYKDKITETIENKSHFGTNNEYIVVIDLYK